MWKRCAWKFFSKSPGALLQLKDPAAALLTVLAAVIFLSGCASFQRRGWREKLDEELPVLGHRNWILVADSAYPAQSRPGMETIATGASQIEAIKWVLKAIDESPHIRAHVYLDKEIQYVSEKDAPGIEAYRKELAAILEGRPVEEVWHVDLIAKLDETAKMFKVLVLKTNLAVPYTSVFLELDCGYWSAEGERRMREAMRKE